jgi:hypothetical protein
MWANNGDTISRQYAGTAALKGDFTRTGERRITGVMKDGYNSASRYYFNRFKDAYRQATIDTMQGIPISDDLNSPENDNLVDSSLSSYTDQEHHERVKMVIEDCKKILIPEDEVILGGWPLIDADPNTCSSSIADNDMDTVLVLTKDCYYVAEYDDQTDRIVKYQKVLLEDLEKIELGPEPNQIFSIKSNQSCCVRFHYTIDGVSGYFHMFRSTNTRFFNNMAIPIRNSEEAIESLKAICESFKVALSVKSLNVPFYEGKLDRRKSKPTNFIQESPQSRDLLKVGQMPRNISDGQLLTLKNVGSRAITNVYSQFNRLKGKWSTNDKQKPITESSLQKPLSNPLFNVDSSCEEDSEEEDSLRKLTNNKILKQNLSITGIHGTVERTISSDYSECSDIEDQDINLPQMEMNEIPMARNRADLDQVLESCGILATSPPLIGTQLPVDSDGMVIKPTEKSVFHEVDDFVLDAMKKASLKQLHRKASQSQLSLSSQHEMRTYPSTPQIYIDDSGSKGALSCGDSSLIGRNKKLSKSSENLETNRMTTTPLDNSSSMSCSSYATLAKNELSFSTTSKETSLGNDILNTCNKMKTSHSETAIQVSLHILLLIKTNLDSILVTVESILSSFRNFYFNFFFCSLLKDFSDELSLNLSNPMSSPIIFKKDLVLSPLSRIAKGVQNLGINFRVGTIGEQQSPIDSDFYQLINKRKAESKSKIIEL